MKFQCTECDGRVCEASIIDDGEPLAPEDCIMGGGDCCAWSPVEEED